MSPLDDFWQRHDWRLLQNINRWEISREGDLVYLTLEARDREKYRLLCLCDGYPQRPPGVVFVDSNNNKMARQAWPRGNHAFMEVVKPPSNCFLCMPLTREGLQHHREWVNNPAVNPWNETRTLIEIFNFVQGLLRSKDYEGRCT